MTIQDIKAKLSITEVLTHYGLQADKNKRICCPFHEDKTPSMQVYPATNTVYCFSANCSTHGKAMDSIEFVQRKENCSKHEALKKCTSLVKEIPVKPTPVKEVIPKQPVKKEAKSLNEVFTQLLSNTDSTGQLQAFLQSRNLDPAKLEIGYNARTISSLKHCIVFALRDKTGDVVSLYGRSIYNNTHQKHFYQAERSGLYPCHPKQDTVKLILTEAIIDAATLLQLAGINEQYSVLACYGTNGLNEEIQYAITALPNLKEIIFAFDNDEAGAAATEKYAKELKVLLPQVSFSKIELPCKDVNETLQAHDSGVFEQLLSERSILMKAAEVFLSNEKKNINAENFMPLVTAQYLNTSNPEQITYHTEELLITLLGGVSLQNLDRLRVTIYLRRNPHVNAQQSMRQNIDLYQDDLVEKFVRKSAEKLDHSTSLIGGVIAELTEALEAWRIKQIENKKATKPLKKLLTQLEKETALAQLKNPDLLQWTLDSLQGTGIVGEYENAGVLCVAMISRISEDPVSVICLSQSGSGKSYLLERVAKCFPKEEIIENTQFTDNSFYYWQDGIKGKIILIEDMEGAQNVEYSIRELISKKYITKTTVHKDAKGNMQTVQHRVEGPATFLGCSTKEKLYEDNANRCILIYLDNSQAQDKHIMSYQKKARAGQTDQAGEQQTRALLSDMQRLLKPKKVINPYATLIELPESVLKPRRSIGILLSFIEAITLYHQYQCEKKDQVLITHPTHIAWGFRLLKESLFRKSDELSAAVRIFLEQIQDYTKQAKKKSFYMQELRLALRLHPRTAQRYLYELSLFGYVKITGGNKYRRGYEYECTPLAAQQSLQSSIDTHIEKVMQRIWKEHNKKGQYDSATENDKNNLVVLN